HLGFAVDDLGFASSFGVFNSRFFSSFRFELRLFDLLLLEWQEISHGIGLALGLKHTNGGLAFGVLHLLGLGGFGVSFADLDLLLMNRGFDAHAVVFLLF